MHIKISHDECRKAPQHIVQLLPDEQEFRNASNVSLENYLQFPLAHLSRCVRVILRNLFPTALKETPYRTQQ